MEDFEPVSYTHLEEGLYQDCTRFEVKLILRYHSQAILGLFRDWTEDDTKNLDQIVHTVFRILTEGISPREKNSEKVVI